MRGGQDGWIGRGTLRGRGALSAALAAALVAAAAGCGAERRGPPAAPPVALEDAQARRGERLFYRYCYQCHPGGEAGLGPALNDKPLPGFLIHAQIREGLGAMPSFPERILSDADVSAIIAYMDELRESPATRQRAARR